MHTFSCLNTMGKKRRNCFITVVFCVLVHGLSRCITSVNLHYGLCRFWHSLLPEIIFISRRNKIKKFRWKELGFDELIENILTIFSKRIFLIWLLHIPPNETVYFSPKINILIYVHQRPICICCLWINQP